MEEANQARRSTRPLEATLSFGFAAGCEAVALPRRTEWLLILGAMPLVRPWPIRTKPEPGADFSYKQPILNLSRGPQMKLTTLAFILLLTCSVYTVNGQEQPKQLDDATKLKIQKLRELEAQLDSLSPGYEAPLLQATWGRRPGLPLLPKKDTPRPSIVFLQTGPVSQLGYLSACPLRRVRETRKPLSY